MSCKRTCRKPSPRKQPAKYALATNLDALRKELDWVLPDDAIFADCRLHGNVRWNPQQVALQALLWRWEESKHLTRSFDHAVDICRDCGFNAVANNYPTFMNALDRYRDGLVKPLDRRLRMLQEEVDSDFWRVDGWVLMAFDGSRLSAARTRSNEKAFCAPNYGFGTTARYRPKKSQGMRRKRNKQKPPQPQHPQVWATMFYHMSLRMPWSWRLGPSNSSERQHVSEMLSEEKLPKNTLFCGDAGFVGYPLWRQLVDSNCDFLVRVGGNAQLLGSFSEVQRKGDGLVWCWPQGSARKKSPLHLRLIRVKIGRTHMWMLTSVLDRDRLTKKMVVRIYKLRWGIELEFRGLKQTLENWKLQGRTGKRVLIELDWSIRAMMVAKLIALRAQLKAKAQQPKKKSTYDPSELSLAKTMHAIRDCLRYGHKTPVLGKDLESRLSQAMRIAYRSQASKKARYRPKNPDKRPLGDPKVKRPDAKTQAILREIAAQLAV